MRPLRGCYNQPWNWCHCAGLTCWLADYGAAKPLAKMCTCSEYALTEQLETVALAKYLTFLQPEYILRAASEQLLILLQLILSRILHFRFHHSSRILFEIKHNQTYFRFFIL